MGAHCLKVSDDYVMDCTTKTELATKDGFSGCASGYTMMSCNQWDQNPSGSIDDYHIQSNGKCYVQRDGWIKVMANAVCCKLRKTPAPTTPPADCSALAIDDYLTGCSTEFKSNSEELSTAISWWCCWSRCFSQFTV